MRLDILVFGAHPDDAELGCGGTIALHVKAGHKVGVVDLTRGELGTRGTVQTRDAEAAEASRVLGLSVRDNLNLPDGFFENARAHQLEIVKAVRKYQPTIVLANARYDRHPDHGRGSDLAYEGCFLAGLAKIETHLDGAAQKAWRPKAMYHYVQSQFIMPDFVVDISDTWETKIASIRAYRSQFFDPNSKEPETYISNPAFLKMVEARSIELGHGIGVKHGESFTTRSWIGVKSLMDIF